VFDDFATEFSKFSIQLLNSLCKLFNCRCLTNSSVIDGIYYTASEFIELRYDLSNYTLVREVLLSCQQDNGLNEDGVLGMAGLNADLNLLQGDL
jgi:hypothetical protein